MLPHQAYAQHAIPALHGSGYSDRLQELKNELAESTKRRQQLSSTLQSLERAAQDSCMQMQELRQESERRERDFERERYEAQHRVLGMVQASNEEYLMQREKLAQALEVNRTVLQSLSGTTFDITSINMAAMQAPLPPAPSFDNMSWADRPSEDIRNMSGAGTSAVLEDAGKGNNWLGRETRQMASSGAGKVQVQTALA